MAFRSRSIHWSLRLGQTAFGLIVAGLAILGTALFSRPSPSTVDRIEQLTPLSRAELLAAPAASDVLIEGRISDRNEVLGHGFVAYTRDHGVPDIRNDTVWRTDEDATPALVVAMADGPITVAGNYRLSGNLPVIVEGDYRYTGLAVGDQVMVIGRPAFGNIAEQIHSASIILGSHASYPRPGINPLPLIFALGLIAVGGGIMAWLLRRGYRPFGNPQTGR